MLWHKIENLLKNSLTDILVAHLCQENYTVVTDIPYNDLYWGLEEVREKDLSYHGHNIHWEAVDYCGLVKVIVSRKEK